MAVLPGGGCAAHARWHRVKAVPRLFHQREGALTRELVRRPGGFGLGQVPERLAPDATTSMVCGFCSTGCSLDVHLRDGQAVNLSPTAAYPVNLGMACPKGWEALTPLRAPDRATTPLLRDGRGRLGMHLENNHAEEQFASLLDRERERMENS